MGMGRTGCQIERARAEGCQTDARPARQPAVCGSHESGCLLVTSQYQFDARVTQRFDNVEIFFSGDPEDLLDTLVL
jgi:hypothetical protein